MCLVEISVKLIIAPVYTYNFPVYTYTHAVIKQNRLEREGVESAGGGQKIGRRANLWGWHL